MNAPSAVTPRTTTGPPRFGTTTAQTPASSAYSTRACGSEPATAPVTGTISSARASGSRPSWSRGMKLTTMVTQ